MCTFIKNRLCDKKGFNSMQIVIGSLITVVLFACMIDIINISNKMQSVSSVMTYVSKVVSNQGCLDNNPESSYSNKNYKIEYVRNKKYVKSQDLYNNVKNIMESDGIPSDSWRVYVGDKLLTTSTKTALFDFKDKIPVSVEIDYSWDVLSTLLPLPSDLIGGTFLSKQKVTSVYKIRNSSEEDMGFTYGS